MTRMPVLFAGHGSPMNALENNQFTREWKRLAAEIPQPTAICSVSAHWYTKGTLIADQEKPQTIYDMYGFPQELYELNYDAPGSPQYAHLAQELITSETNYDCSWGIDHGTWSVLIHMYPEKQIPVFQISVDAYAPPAEHYRIGQELSLLRDQGVLIFGTGNIVHNLRRVDWNRETEGFDWALEFDDFIHTNIKARTHENILNYGEYGEAANLAVPAPDHFYPLLYVLGASTAADKMTVFNRQPVLGSLTMTGYLFTDN